MEFTNEKFSDMCAVFKKISGYCTDIHIKGGLISQRSDNNTLMIVGDIRPIVGETDFLLNSAQAKVGMFSVFDGGDGVNIDDDGDSYIIRDSKSRLTFRKLTEDALMNKYIPDDKDKDRFIHVFEITIPQQTIKQMISMTKQVKSDVFNLRISNGVIKGNIESSDRNTNYDVTFATDVEFSCAMDGEKTTKLSLDCMKSFNSDVKLKLEKVLANDGTDLGQCYIYMTSEIAGVEISFIQYLRLR